MAAFLQRWRVAVLLKGALPAMRMERLFKASVPRWPVAAFLPRWRVAVLLAGPLLLTACHIPSAEKPRYVLPATTAQIDLTPPPPDLPLVHLDEMKERVAAVPRLSSFVLYSNGEILAEHYGRGMHARRTINVKSASKSVLSALVGLAIREGYIEGLDDPVSRYLPRYFPAEELTVRHLLTMSSGYRSTSFRNYGAWVTSRDWVGYVLRSHPEAPPGTRMRYSTGDTHVLAAVLTEATGMPLARFADRYLFRPLNTRVGGWDRDPQGYYFGGNNMALSPQGLLSFGQLYLYDGVYNGQRILDSAWVANSLTPWFEGTSFNQRRHDYGFLWWHNTFAEHQAWFAWGYGGQYVFVIPELEAVAVFTGDPDTRAPGGSNRIYEVLEESVIPALFHLRARSEKVSERVATERSEPYY